MTAPRPHLRIVHVDPEPGLSGGQVQVFLLLEGLRELGHQNVLITLPGSRSEAEARARGLETRALAMRNYADVRAVLALRRAFLEARADLVHLHTGRATWLGGIAARLAGVPAIATRRMDRRVRRGWRTRLIYRSLVERAVAISPAVARRLSEGGVPTERTVTIPSAVDPAALVTAVGREQTRALGGVPAGTPLLLSLAALFRRKGLDVLLDALARLPETSPQAQLWIAGDGPERATLERRARELGLADRVRFLGPRSDAADLLAACDLFVLPSRLEGLGVAALEAMAAARPVLASRVGGLAEAVVEGRTGLLVPPDDPAALSVALGRLLEDDALRNRLGEAGPGRVAEGFLAEQMVSAYESLYYEVLASRARQAASAAVLPSR
jgi:glycosyltransferase involved in cell wall biosynthesis